MNQDKNQKDQNKNQKDQDKNQKDQNKNQKDQDKNQKDQNKNQKDQNKNQKDQDKNQKDQDIKTKIKENSEDCKIHTNINKQLIEEKNRFIRLFAEFENYKKRIQKERLNIFKTANIDIIMSLLPVLDDFERGFLEISKSKGMMLIREKFINILKEKGLKKANIEKGDIFNTDLHEAITQIDITESNLKGKIVNVVESGYLLGDKVIRHAKVIIGK